MSEVLRGSCPRQTVGRPLEDVLGLCRGENHETFATVAAAKPARGGGVTAGFRVMDCVFDHPIPHIWIRRNELSNLKNKSSILAVPLVGVSVNVVNPCQNLSRTDKLFNSHGSDTLHPLITT